MNPFVLNRGPGSRVRPLPMVRMPKPDHCYLCASGYLHMVQTHDHRVGTVMVITADGLMHCTICHGRGMDLERIGLGQ